MRFVEEEDQLGLVDIADFGKLFKELGEQPEQESGVEARRLHQLVGGKDGDETAAIGIDAHEIGNRERPLAEEMVGALLFEHQQSALNGADGGGGDIAVAAGDFLGALLHIAQKRAQILEVEQQQPFLVGNAEGDVEHAFLGVVEVENAGEQYRAHLGNGGAHRMPLLAEQVPEDHRKDVVVVVGEADILGALGLPALRLAHLGDAGKVALDIGGKDGDAGGGKAFGQDLQAHGLAGAGGAGDQAVAIAVFEIEIFRPVARPEIDLAVNEHAEPAICLETEPVIATRPDTAKLERICAVARH